MLMVERIGILFELRVEGIAEGRRVVKKAAARMRSQGLLSLDQGFFPQVILIWEKLKSAIHGYKHGHWKSLGFLRVRGKLRNAD